MIERILLGLLIAVVIYAAIPKKGRPNHGRRSNAAAIKGVMATLGAFAFFAISIGSAAMRSSSDDSALPESIGVGIIGAGIGYGIGAALVKLFLKDHPKTENLSDDESRT